MPAQGPKLTDEIRTFVVQHLAMFDTPSVVVAAVKAEFKIEMPRQAIEYYDPDKKAGATLSAKWKELFRATRKEFLEDTSKIAISHRAVRIRALERMAARAEERGNLQLSAQLLEQAAKEMGGAFTNRRELTGPDGSPVQFERIERVIVDAPDTNRAGIPAAPDAKSI